MKSTLFFGLLAAALYCVFILGINLGYLFLLGAFILWGYVMFKASLQ